MQLVGLSLKLVFLRQTSLHAALQSGSLGVRSCPCVSGLPRGTCCLSVELYPSCCTTVFWPGLAFPEAGRENQLPRLSLLRL